MRINNVLLIYRINMIQIALLLEMCRNCNNYYIQINKLIHLPGDDIL